MIEEALGRKRPKYAELDEEARQRGWQAHTRPVEIGVRGFVAKSTTILLLDLSFCGWLLKGGLKELSEAAEKASKCLWLRRSQTTWGRELT